MKLTKEYFKDYITDKEWLDKLWVYFNIEGEELFGKIKERKGLGKKIYPISEKCFTAFNLCPWNDVRVVILGQDPYYTPNVANGLAFATDMSAYIPPSLSNILREVENDVHDGLNINRDPSLKTWAKQGVLLLNTALTVEQDDPLSHSNIWRSFTNYVISILNDDKNGLTFLLWGNHAKSYSHLINQNRHHILESGHPSPLSANKGLWFGNKHFSKTNDIIRGQNGPEFEIKW